MPWTTLIRPPPPGLGVRSRVRGRSGTRTRETTRFTSRARTRTPCWARTTKHGAQGYTFEQQGEREFEAMRDWVLGPLVDGGNMARLLERRELELIEELERTGANDLGPRSPGSHLMAVAEQIGHVR